MPLCTKFGKSLSSIHSDIERETILNDLRYLKNTLSAMMTAKEEHNIYELG